MWDGFFATESRLQSHSNVIQIHMLLHVYKHRITTAKKDEQVLLCKLLTRLLHSLATALVWVTVDTHYKQTFRGRLEGHVYQRITYV